MRYRKKSPPPEACKLHTHTHTFGPFDVGGKANPISICMLVCVVIYDSK